MEMNGNVLDRVATELQEGGFSSFVLVSCYTDDYPILYVSQEFENLTHWTESEIIGVCGWMEFLFGPDTRSEHVLRIKKSVMGKLPMKTSIVLYKKADPGDVLGSPFIATLEVQPIPSETSQTSPLLTVSLSLLADLSNETDHFLLRNERKNRSKQGGKLRKKVRRITKRIRNVDPGSDTLQRKTPKRLESAHEFFEHQVDTTGKKTQKPTGIIYHNGTFKILWDWLVMVATFYVAIVTPYDAVFRRDYHNNRIEDIIGDVTVEIIFMLDVVFNFRTTFFDKTGGLVVEQKRITKHYIFTWFFIDAPSAIPFEIVRYLGAAYLSNIALMMKCVRLLRLARLYGVLERYSQYSSIILVINMTVYVLLAHWFACIWYLIGKNEYEDSDVKWKVGWISRLCNLFRFGDPNADPLPEIPKLNLYLTSLYYCMTILTTVGFGNEAANTNAEKIFTCAAMIVCFQMSLSQKYWSALYFSMTLLTSVGFGNIAANSELEKAAVCILMPISALMHAVVFGNVTAIIQRMYARRFSYDIQANELRDFYRIYRIPKPLKRKIENFYQSFWTVNRGIKHEQLILDFPEDLKADVSIHIFSEFLNHPIFEGAPKSCLKSIALKMKHSFINPNEILIQKGDVVSNLYYIRNGCVEIRQDESIVGVAGKDEILGLDFTQSSLFGKSCAAAKATLHCDMHIIPTNALIDALSLYPEFAILFSQRLPAELAFDLSSPDEIELPGSPVSISGSPLMREVSSDELFSPSPFGSSISLPPILQINPDPTAHFLGLPRDPISSRAVRTVENMRIAEIQMALGKMRQNMDLITQHLLLMTKRRSHEEKPARYPRNKNQ